jgi:pyruvate/2-oxoglutarate dehydrogenase complex dihydrolipoamide dehydrogenase (E3) component
MSTATALVMPEDKYNTVLISNVHPADWINPEPTGRYNLVVIGGGSAGLVCAIGAAGLGAKVALVERHFLGGDCLNVGCVPSKTVIRSAKLVGEMQSAGEFGLSFPGGVEVDFGAVMERVRRVRSEISDHDSAGRLQKLGIDLFLGEGRFTGHSTLEVGGKTLTFKKAVIATGSRPMDLSIPGLAEAGYLTNETVFNLTGQPGHLAIIGAGPIGAELAQAFRRLGSEVTVFDILSQVLGREDRDAAEIVEAALRREGVNLILDAGIKQISSDNRQKTFHYEHDGQANKISVDEILVAAGRSPNVESLNLEAAGVVYHKKGVEVNDFLQTSNPNIFAAGDVAQKYQFTHTADATARIVLQNALFMGRKKLSALTVPWVTYTDPEVAHVGLYPAEAESVGIAVDTFLQPLRGVDRAAADGDTEGFVKVHVEQGTDRIVGATIVARHAGEMISEITTAMVGGIGLKTLATVIHPYPTQAEAIKKVADAYNRTRLTPAVKSAFEKWLTITNDTRLEEPVVRIAASAIVATLVTAVFVGAFKTVTSLLKG